MGLDVLGEKFYGLISLFSFLEFGHEASKSVAGVKFLLTILSFVV